MRIISKFHDYYDSVMKSGMDREVVYVRDTKEIDLDKKYDLSYLQSRHGSYCTVHLNYLGYCGQIFKVCEVIVTTQILHPYSTSRVRYVFYDFQEFKTFMLENKLASEWDFNRSKWWPGTYQKFDELDTIKLKELFHEHQTPLFLISSLSRDGKKHKITIHPNLKSFEFQKIKDTYTAYQDIFQYVAGTLNRSEATMVKISDKDKIHKHGFDKWSFRKMPTKKKP